MTDVLIADDPLYDELYDIRREATEMGNFVEGDMNLAVCALGERGPVQRGFLRELLGLPPFHRHVMAVGRQGYSCFSFDACSVAFRAHQRFSSAIYHHPAAGNEQRIGLLEMDEPQHRACRATIQPLFLKPQALTWWRERWIDEIVGALIAKLHSQTRADLNLQLCARLPVHTITRAVGMEGDDSLVFRSALLKSGGGASVSADDQRTAAQTVERMLLDLIALRRIKPADDLVSHLIRAELALSRETKRPLSDSEIMIHARLVLLAGGGTTWRQLGITLWALLTHLDQLEELKADRRLVDKAIEESLRWNPTDPVFSRLVVQDTELGGVALAAGAIVEICLGAANRDPSRWEDPHTYNLHRPYQVHLGFGIGAHLCLGQHVSRMEMNAALNALLDAFPNLRLDPDQPSPRLIGGLEQRGVSALPVLLR